MKRGYLMLFMLLMTTCMFSQTKKTSQNKSSVKSEITNEYQFTVIDTVFYSSMRIESKLQTPQDIKIIVADAAGKTVNEQEFKNRAGGVFKIGITDIPPGKYTISIYGTNGKVLYKGQIEKGI